MSSEFTGFYLKDKKKELKNKWKIMEFIEDELEEHKKSKDESSTKENNSEKKSSKSYDTKEIKVYTISRLKEILKRKKNAKS